VVFCLGPSPAAFAAQNLRGARQRGDCLAFAVDGGADLIIGPQDPWLSVQERLPAGWQPDFIALYLPYTSVPPCLWSAPVPLVGLAADWNLLWHWYRHCLRQCDAVLTDPVGVETLRSAGLAHAAAANLFGAEWAWLEPAPEQPRDIDILFVGNLDGGVQRRRQPWLGRLARLADHRRVLIGSGVFGEDYRRLLRRACIVFNHSIRGEANRRAFQAAAAGALLFQEAGNRELGAYFRDGQECVLYTEGDLETLLEHYLEHEDERRAIAGAARAKLPDFSFARLWDASVTELEARWIELTGRA